LTICSRPRPFYHSRPLFSTIAQDPP
jgi:hypothetical protein